MDKLIKEYQIQARLVEDCKAEIIALDDSGRKTMKIKTRDRFAIFLMLAAILSQVLIRPLQSF